MSDVSDKLQEWKDQGQEIASLLKARLLELDVERTDVLQQLEKIEGKAASNGHSPGRYKRSKVKVRAVILSLLKEAGEAGLPAGEIIQGVHDEAGDSVQRSTVMTHLSRLKAAGEINGEGERGFRRYTVVAS
jgi:DNA-binding transcriptional ArsR family regulator